MVLKEEERERFLGSWERCGNFGLLYMVAAGRQLKRAGSEMERDRKRTTSGRAPLRPYQTLVQARTVRRQEEVGGDEIQTVEWVRRRRPLNDGLRRNRAGERPCWGRCQSRPGVGLLRHVTVNREGVILQQIVSWCCASRAGCESPVVSTAQKKLRRSHQMQPWAQGLAAACAPEGPDAQGSDKGDKAPRAGPAPSTAGSRRRGQVTGRTGRDCTSNGARDSREIIVDCALQ